MTKINNLVYPKRKVRVRQPPNYRPFSQEHITFRWSVEDVVVRVGSHPPIFQDIVLQGKPSRHRTHIALRSRHHVHKNGGFGQTLGSSSIYRLGYRGGCSERGCRTFAVHITSWATPYPPDIWSWLTEQPSLPPVCRGRDVGTCADAVAIVRALKTSTFSSPTCFLSVQRGTVSFPIVLTVSHRVALSPCPGLPTMSLAASA